MVHAASEPGSFTVGGKLGPEPTDGLVITCSDRRFRRPVEHFLYKKLGLGNYDLIAVPGGAYMLAVPDVLPKQVKIGTRMVKFLMRNHVPPRVVLVAHEGCGRYLESFATWLKRPGFSVEARQKRDLDAVRRLIQEAFPAVPVDVFYARPSGGDSVEFESV